MTTVDEARAALPSDVCLCGHARRHHTRGANQTGETWGQCWAKPYWHPDSPLYRDNDCRFFENDATFVVLRRDPANGRFTR